VRPEGAAAAQAADEAEQRREQAAAQSMVNLAVAWSLVLLCCTHHFGHLMHSMGYHQFAHGPLMDALGSPAVSGALGAFALLGPGRT
jgi:Cu2+-exporting ATPase